jgi:hypothetical protein
VIIDEIVEINQELDLNEFLKWTTKITGRYMGQAYAEAYGKSGQCGTSNKDQTD